MATLQDPQRRQKLPRPTHPESKHTNRGNRRTGPARGTHSGLRRGTVEWRKDPEILARLETVAALTAAGLTAREIGERLDLHRATIDEDRQRLRELQQDRVIGTVAESVAKLRHVHRRALDEFEATREASLNRSAYLGVARQAVMDEAKLLGQEPRQRIDLEATLHDGDRALRDDLARAIAALRPDVDLAALGLGPVGPRPLALEPPSPHGHATAGPLGADHGVPGWARGREDPERRGGGL